MHGVDDPHRPAQVDTDRPGHTALLCHANMSMRASVHDHERAVGSVLVSASPPRWLTECMSETFWIALTAISGVVTALGTAAMAVAIIYTAVIGVRTFEASKRDSQARTRPVIVAELKRELLSHGTIMLSIRNFGASIAKDVTVTFEPAPPNDLSALPSSDMMKWIYQRYATPITTWAPGWTLSNVIRAGQDELLPVTITINYIGPDGAPYQERYYLNPDHVLKDTTSTPSKTDDPIKLEQHKLAALQALVRTIRSG